jgi:hypothetical protein
MNAAGSEYMLDGSEDGAASLFYDGVNKLQTTSTGVTVTGTLTATSGIFNDDLTLYGANYNVYWDKSDDSLNVNDNAKIKVGSSGDLQIWHDGSHSYVMNQIGSLKLRINSSEDGIIINPNGAVELYHDNFKCFNTTTSGISLYGPESGDCVINMYADEADDNTDFWRIVAGQGGVWYLKNFAPGSWDNMISATVNAGVSLFYDNVKKLETNSGGVLVTGTLKINDGSDSDNRIALGNSGDLLLYHDGTDSFVENNTGILSIRSASGHSGKVKLQPKYGENSLTCDPDGAVTLYYNNSKKFETDSEGIHVSGNIGMGDSDVIQLGDGDDFHIQFDGSNCKIRAVNGNLTLTSDDTDKLELQPDGDYFIKAHMQAWVNDTYDVGRPGHRWDDIYATNSTISTSDRNEKNTIVDSDLGLSFVNKLKPVSYKLNGKTRTHYGLIAQDVETTLSDISKSTTDFAGFIKTTLTKDGYTKEDLDTPKDVYGLRYNEFIAPLIKAVQELSAEVETLKTKVAALESS